MSAKIKDNVFYVYEHWRPDTNQCFWVGKGYGERAFCLKKRNCHHSNIIRKIYELGFRVDVRIIYNQLSEDDALQIEIQRIAHWRGLGIKLANMTAGGEGLTGFIHSEETKTILREKRAKQKLPPLSEEARRSSSIKNSLAKKGRKNPAHGDRLRGRRLTEEHKRNIGLGLVGVVFTEERCSKISAALSGYVHTEQTKINMSLAHIGKAHPESAKNKKRGRKWINNGSSQRFLRVDENIPDGWQYGRLPQSEESILRMAASQSIRLSKVSMEEKIRIGRLGATARWGN